MSVSFKELFSEMELDIEKEEKQKKNLKNDEFSDLEDIFLNQEVHQEPIFKNKKSTHKKINKQSKNKNINSVIVENQDNPSNNLILEKLLSIEHFMSELSKNNKNNENKENEKIESLTIVKLLISRLKNKEIIYQVQTEDKIEEIELSAYYEKAQFVDMIKMFNITLRVDNNLKFDSLLYKEYYNTLKILSESLLSNSFQYLDKNKSIFTLFEDKYDELLKDSLLKPFIEKLQIQNRDMLKALSFVEYKQDYYFAKLFIDKGLILNSLTIINEMLGKYIVWGVYNLSNEIRDFIDSYIDRITLNVSSKKQFYKLHKSAKEYFINTFIDKDKKTFFEFQNNINSKIDVEINKIASKNKKSLYPLFVEYANLINRVKDIRNDLAHGNNQKSYDNINLIIDEMLVDFKYLAIDKNILSY